MNGKIPIISKVFITPSSLHTADECSKAIKYTAWSVADDFKVDNVRI